MKTKHTSFLLVLATAALLSTSFNASAAAGQQCATNVPGMLKKSVSYKALDAYLTANDVTSLKNALADMRDDGGYQSLLSIANTIATKAGATGRLVVTLADGTVVVDTSKRDSNTYANFAAKAINENHNTRLAFLNAQLWPCGLGIEAKRSSSTGLMEYYVAKRLGDYLGSVGTARISMSQ